MEVTPDGIVADDESQTIEISADPAEGISIASDEAAEVTLGIPGRSTADGVKIGDSLVYQDAATDSTVVARPTEDGAQALIVLDSPAAPSRFVFPIEVAGSPVELRAGSDGSVEIFAQGSTFGTRGAACAVYAAAIVYQANRASNRGMCLKLKYPRFGPKATCRTSTRAGSVADMRLLTLREIKEFTYSNLRGLAAGLIVLLVAGLILGSWLHYQFGEGWAAAAVVSLIPIHYFWVCHQVGQFER
ncbi:hypothetical protein BN381_100178 [Candidatus Microthrix parvicella RN1]|uniref:Uncharacterized protein n=1 Tax=Candidatus Neomicrothrix parvicella RN1 TaxID=1229780 RepID=R4YZ82_9ACTN|nr:hypothetical protein BN381_100178 [Candidatus Microthrix parvicella RN1]